MGPHLMVMKVIFLGFSVKYDFGFRQSITIFVDLRATSRCMSKNIIRCWFFFGSY